MWTPREEIASTVGGSPRAGTQSRFCPRSNSLTLMTPMVSLAPLQWRTLSHTEGMPHRSGDTGGTGTHAGWQQPRAVTRRPPLRPPVEGEDAETWLRGIRGENMLAGSLRSCDISGRPCPVSRARGTIGSSPKSLRIVTVRCRTQQPVTSPSPSSGQGVQPPAGQART